jgi:gas vesicle protein
MAYEYDRMEQNGSGGSFMMGLLAGTMIGAGLGLLLAPKSGSELRSQIAGQAGRLRDAADKTYTQATEKVNDIVERGRDAYDRARHAGVMATQGTVHE